MHRYCRLPQEVAAINDDKNIVILRKDLHHLFDARRFTFIPKRFGSSESAELVTHVLLPSGSAEFIGLYHNRLPQPIRGISVEFLFARFAWCLFRDEHLQFFLSDLEYVVCLWDKARDETHTRTLQGPDVRSIAQVFQPPRSQSRSVSQKRRSLLTQDQDGADDGDGYWSDDGDSTSDEPELNSFDEPPRGRRRKRSWEDLGRGNGHLPSLSSSSATHSSFAGGPVSRPLTPKEGRDTTASPAPASDHIGSERPQKRIHTEGMPGKERRVNDHGTL
ncbi:uncharacterized protein B0T15DRAFT_81386 [Chaetomium strumarium]|uniref:HNH nuclease domain-containing protein n=1 Tax=Chaetomium strumarium TaxID=1170767 RepID=A0AAJ0M7F0_9PEZI|nr:hypothetical protein B0T15DRAFT_81386 [Chaetomium strumarium]